MKKKEEWEKELREVGEIAASTDDCSDIECVVRYAASLLAKKTKNE